MAEADLEGRFVRNNAGFSDMVGYSADELVGRSVFEFVHEDERARAEQGFHALVSGRIAKHEMDKRVRRKDGTWMWVRVHVSLIRDREGRPYRAAAVLQDITATKAATELYEKQLRLFDGVVSTTPDFVYVFDRQGRFLYANRRLLEVWGMKLDAIVGKTCFELGYEQWHHDMHMREIAEVIRTRRPIRGEVPFKAPLTGIFGVYEYIFTPVIGADGEVEVIAGTTRDVTDRKRDEEALRQAERQQRMLAYIAELAGTTADIGELVRNACAYVAREIGVARAGLSELDLSAGRIVVRYDYHGDLPSLAGTYPLPQDLQDLEDVRAGRVSVVEDMAADPRLAAAYHETFAALHARARVVVPLRRAGEWSARFWMCDPEPRRWLDADVETVRLAADRLWAMVERKRAEEALRASEDRFRAVLENMSEGVIILDRAGTLVYQNPASLRIHGFKTAADGQFTSAELPLQWRGADLDGNPVPFDKWPISRMLRGERFSNHTIHAVNTVTGSEFYATYNGAPIRDGEGRMVLGFVTVREITQEVRARRALERNQRRLSAFFDSEMMGALYWNMEGRITGANDRFLRMVGYTREELESGSLNWAEMTPPEFREADERAVRELRENGIDRPYRKEFVRKDGSRLPILIGAAMIDERRQDGVAFVLDISEQEAAAARTTEVQRKLNAALLAGEIGTFEWRVVEDRLWADRNFARIVSVALDAVGTAPFDAFMRQVVREDRERLLYKIQVALASRVPLEAEFRVTSRGDVRWVIARAVVECDATGAPDRMPGVLIDITDRKLAEETFRSTFENAAVGIAHVAPDHRFIRVNRTLSTITGYPREELLRLTPMDVTHPDDIDADLAQAARLAAGEITTYSMEKRYRRKDGTIIWGNLTVSVVRHEDGSPWYFIAVVEDITRRRTAEADLADAQARLRQHAADLEVAVAQRTAQLEDVVRELSTFSYSVSHDLRAPLRSITNFSDLLLQEHSAGLDEAGRDFLNRIVKASRKMDALIRDVLAYSRISRVDLQFEEVALDPLVRSIIDTQFATHAGNITCMSPLAAVNGSRVALEQCVSNLLGNAIKFSRPGVPLSITVSTEVRGDSVRLWVSDNGMGFPPEYQHKVWGMFERLHHSVEGTGVGLAIVRRAVERMAGRVGVETAPGAGSRFWIELPRPGVVVDGQVRSTQALLPLVG